VAGAGDRPHPFVPCSDGSQRVIDSSTSQRRAALYGKKVAVVEADPYLGGTCVNVGKSFLFLPQVPSDHSFARMHPEKGKEWWHNVPLHGSDTTLFIDNVACRRPS